MKHERCPKGSREGEKEGGESLHKGKIGHLERERDEPSAPGVHPFIQRDESGWKSRKRIIRVDTHGRIGKDS